MSKSREKYWYASSVMTVILVTMGLLVPRAVAAPADFYTPPSPLPSLADGDLIRSEPSALALRVPDGRGGAFPADSQRLMYQSTDANGKPVAVTGTFLKPTLPWKGAGPRPLVSFAVGTQGQGDQCAPSKLLGNLLTYDPPLGLNTEYETAFIDAMLVAGMAVVVTDYEGLGTPGIHTFVNRESEGHAVLDAARAAQRLPGSGVVPGGPVGIWGYSQGGGAAASAAELQPLYAPEMNLVGTYAGAPPANLADTLARIDGSFLTGLIGYAINSISYAYPDIRPVIDAQVNDRGRAMLADVANQCVVATALTYGFRKTSEFTRTGEPLSDVIRRIPAAQAIIDDQLIGKLKPETPVLIQQGRNDDVVPYQQGHQLGLDWCGQGATVQFNTNQFPPLFPGLGANHVLPAFLDSPAAFSWMVDRFNGLPAPSNCGAF